MPIDERWSRLGPASNYVNLEGIEFREYQYNIIKAIFEKGNTLVVLPTGLGKTLIAVYSIADSLSSNRKAMLLAPTKPLAEQHYLTLQKMLKLKEGELMLLLGTTNKTKREEQMANARVIVATPQTVANELKKGTLDISRYHSAVFDECHKAVGKYAYTYIADTCSEFGVKTIGLTASPGSKKEKIKKLLQTLKTEHIESRVSSDYDVSKYVMPKSMHIMDIEMTDRIKEMAAMLRPDIDASLSSLNKMGFLHFKHFENIPRGRIIALGNEINRISSDYKYAAIFSYVKLLNLSHAYDLLTVEGIQPFLEYMQSLQDKEKKSKAVQGILNSKRVIAAISSAKAAQSNGEEHPKVIALLDILRNYRGKSVIVFVQYRSTIKMLVEYLNNNGFPSKAFTGKREGVTEAMQKALIEDFRRRDFHVLVASSIGEEGLDIPSVDAVIFYEAIPSEIRNIQRGGRTGRLTPGSIYMLLAKDTKDQIYFYVSRKKEEKMNMLIKSLNRELDRMPKRIIDRNQSKL